MKRDNAFRAIAVVLLSAVACARLGAREARAAELIGGGGWGAGPLTSSLSYSGILIPQPSGLQNNTLTTDVAENRLRGSYRLSDDGIDSYGLLARGSVFYFGAPPVLQGSGVAVENTFYDVEAGADWRHKLEKGRELLVVGTVGSASDQPFYSMAETVFQVNGIYILPTDATHQWIFVVNWSNNRQFLNYVPLPGVVYSLSSDDRRFQLAFGFPFDRLSWEFAPDWALKASFVGISQASAELDFSPWRIWTFYAGYDWGQRSWLRVARIDPLDRFFYDEQRVMGGLRVSILPSLVADLSGGYAYARQAFEAHSYFSSPSGATPMPASCEAQLALTLREPPPSH